MSEHRWSGWPGAWCLDCGAEDQREVCLAQDCGVDHAWTESGEFSPPICENRPCPVPGAGHFDPYRTRL